MTFLPAFDEIVLPSFKYIWTVSNVQIDHCRKAHGKDKGAIENISLYARMCMKFLGHD